MSDSEENMKISLGGRTVPALQSLYGHIYAFRQNAAFRRGRMALSSNQPTEAAESDYTQAMKLLDTIEEDLRTLFIDPYPTQGGKPQRDPDSDSDPQKDEDGKSASTGKGASAPSSYKCPNCGVEMKVTKVLP